MGDSRLDQDEAEAGRDTSQADSVCVGSRLEYAILEPADDSRVQVGVAVLLAGHAGGGVEPYTYTWSVDGAYVGDELEIRWTPMSPGRSIIELIVADGCGSRATTIAVEVE